jgi:hypothetical protein
MKQILFNKQSGLTVIDTLIGLVIAGLSVAAASRVFETYSRSNAKLRSLGQLEDVKAYIRGNLDRERTLGFGEIGNCFSETPTPIALRRSDNSIFVAADANGTAISSSYFVRASCRVLNDVHEITIEFSHVRSSNASVSSSNLAKDSLSGKASTAWRSLYGNGVGAVSPPIFLPAMCITPAVQWLESTESICGPMSSPSMTAFDGGTGRVDDPFLISKKEQLDCMRRWVGSSFRLTKNIDLQGYNLRPLPLGCRYKSTNAKPNSKAEADALDPARLITPPSVFDGGGFKIKNLKMDGISDRTRMTTKYYGVNNDVTTGAKFGIYNWSPVLNSASYNYLGFEDKQGYWAYLRDVHYKLKDPVPYSEGQPVSLFLQTGSMRIKNLQIVDFDLRGREVATLLMDLNGDEQQFINKTGFDIENVHVKGRMIATRRAAGIFLDASRARVSNVSSDLLVSIGEKAYDPNHQFIDIKSTNAIPYATSVGGIGVHMYYGDIDGASVRLRFTGGEKHPDVKKPSANDPCTNLACSGIGGVLTWFRKIGGTSKQVISNVSVDIDTTTLPASYVVGEVGGVAASLTSSGIVSDLSGVIVKNAKVVGKLSNGLAIGGIAGVTNHSTIVDSLSEVSISPILAAAVPSSASMAGGLVGLAYAPVTIRTSAFAGSLPATATYMGGIVGGAFNWRVGVPPVLTAGDLVPCYVYVGVGKSRNLRDPLCIVTPLTTAVSLGGPVDSATSWGLPVIVEGTVTSIAMPMIGQTGPVLASVPPPEEPIPDDVAPPDEIYEEHYEEQQEEQQVEEQYEEPYEEPHYEETPEEPAEEPPYEP